MTRRGLLEALAVALATLAYLWLFRLYGFDLVDEGTLLAQIDRVAHGERAYIDFETGYTPGYFALQSALWRWSGSELVATRTFGVVCHALTVAGLFACMRAWTTRTIAACVALYYVAFLLPVSLRFGAHFNTPYPGWLVAPLALLAQVAVASAMRRRDGAAEQAARHQRILHLALAGLACGAAFSIKPNAGLLALGGATLALSATWSGTAHASGTLAIVLRVAAIAGAVLLLAPGLDVPYGVALLAPVVVASWRGHVAARSAPARASNGAAAATPRAELTALAAGFLGVVLPWIVPLAWTLGPRAFVRDVLLLDGGGVVSAYLLPFPDPSLATLAILLGLGLAAALARGPAAIVAPVVAVAGALLAAPLAGRPVRFAAENLTLWLGPAVLLTGLASAPRRAVRERALISFAAIYQLTLFPRPDLVHVAQSAAPVLLAGAVTWYRLARAWRLAARGGTGPKLAAQAQTRAIRAIAWATPAAVVVVCALRLAPALIDRLRTPLAEIALGSRARVWIAEPYRADLDRVADAARALAAHTEADDLVFTFPDLAGLGFLAARPPASYYVYFVPGRPDRAAQASVVAELESRRPVAAAVGEPRVAAFRGAESYFDQIDDYLATHYRRATRAGDIDVLTRRK